MALVSVQQAWKWFPLQRGTRLPLSAVAPLLLRRAWNEASSRAVLQDINLEVHAGESVGLIGENGAGKSTLLKLLAGVLVPSRGTIRTRGRVAALLELGAGFHPEFTGMQNLELSAALMGLSASQLRRKRDQILAFADIGEFIHEPVKNYSSGMTIRLGFALATAMEPDLLITDEVLAVGDESFQRKCMRWVDQYIDQGGTMLLVSHGMDQVRRLCRRVYWLKDGRVEAQGPADDVVDRYLEYHERKATESTAPDPGGGLYRIREMTVGFESSTNRLTIRARLHSPDDREPVVALGIKDQHGTPVFGVTSEMDGASPRRLGPRRFAYQLTLDLSPLKPGNYRATGHAMDPEGLRLFDTVIREFSIPGSADGAGFLRAAGSDRLSR